MKEMNGLWLQPQTDNIYLVGLTPSLQEELGEIEYINLRPEGPFAIDDVIMNLEASKAAIEIPANISGEIIEINDAVLNDFSLLNSIGNDDHWLLKIKID